MLLPNRILTARRTLGAAFLAIAGSAGAQATPPAAAPSGFATVRGMAMDSIRQRPMSQAIIAVEGTTRIGVTDAAGNFQIDSVPPGSHRLTLEHPMLDTLGLAVMTNALVMRPGEILSVDVATPSAELVVSLRCPAAVRQLRGPAAIMGQVTDADSLKAAVGSRVELVYQESLLGFTGKPVVRTATVDSAGNYRICGLPTPMSGKLQVFKSGVASGQVDVEVTGTLGLRSLSIAAAQTTTVSDTGGRTRQIFTGNARLRGRVLTKAGSPVQSARVSIEGSTTVAITNERGEFSLDSLPSGTQSVEVRKIGYAAADKAVELSARAPVSTDVVLDVAELAPMRIVAGVERALNDMGYNERKQRGMGHFIDGEQVIDRAVKFSDALRGVPNLRVVPGSGGRNVITNSRDPSSGCVNIFVDQARWREVSPGDIDDFVMPHEVRAIESYTANNVPAQFQSGGSSACAAVVVWTTRYLDRKGKKK